MNLLIYLQHPVNQHAARMTHCVHHERVCSMYVYMTECVHLERSARTCLCRPLVNARLDSSQHSPSAFPHHCLHLLLMRLCSQMPDPLAHQYPVPALPSPPCSTTWTIKGPWVRDEWALKYQLSQASAHSFSHCSCIRICSGSYL